LETEPASALIHYPVLDLHRVLTRIIRYASTQAREKYEKGETFEFGRAFVEPLQEFYRSFVLRQGYRDGVAGLVFGMLWHFLYPLLINLYLWELSGYPGAQAPELPQLSIFSLIKRTLKYPRIRQFYISVICQELPGARILFGVAGRVRKLIFKSLRAVQ